MNEAPDDDRIVIAVCCLVVGLLLGYHGARLDRPAPEVRTVYVHVPTASSVEPTPSRPISGSPGVVRRTGASHDR